jgi:RNA recognition motif-containing protein
VLFVIQLAAVLALNGRDLQGRSFDVQVAKEQSLGGQRKGGERQAVGKGEANVHKLRNPKVPSGAAEGKTPAKKAKQNAVPRVEVDATHTLLYVNNLPDDFGVADVSSLFSAALSLEPSAVDGPQVELVHSKFGQFKGRSRGFGFVRVRNEQVEQAMTIHGRDVQGRAIGVTRVKKKEPIPPGMSEPEAAAEEMLK